MEFSITKDFPKLFALKISANGFGAKPEEQSIKALYGHNSQKSEDICRRLASDPYKISFTTLDDFFSLPIIWQTVSKIFEFKDSDKDYAEFKNFSNEIAHLMPLTLETVIPIIKDYISLGGQALDQKKYFKDLLQKGIELNENTKLEIRVENTRFKKMTNFISWLLVRENRELIEPITFILKQGHSSLQINYGRKGHVVFHLRNSNSQCLILDFIPKSQIGSKIYPAMFNFMVEDGINRYDRIFEVKLSDEQVSALKIPEAFMRGGEVYTALATAG